MIIKINHLKQLRNQRNSLKKILPRKHLSKVMISKDFKKRQKNLKPHLLIIPKEKITNTWLNGKKIHFSSANSEDFIIHKDPVRRDKYLTKAMKITNKNGELTHQLPSYPNYWSIKLLN